MKILNNVILVIASFLSCTLFSAPTEKARVKVAAAKDGKILKLSFSTLAGDGLKINADGPWKLEVKEVKGAKLDSLELKRDAWKSDIAGFQVAATPENNSKTIELQYKLTAFVCTVDKSMCYREVVNGKETLKL